MPGWLDAAGRQYVTCLVAGRTEVSRMVGSLNADDVGRSVQVVGWLADAGPPGGTGVVVIGRIRCVTHYGSYQTRFEFEDGVPAVLCRSTGVVRFRDRGDRFSTDEGLPYGVQPWPWEVPTTDR